MIAHWWRLARAAGIKTPVDRYGNETAPSSAVPLSPLIKLLLLPGSRPEPA